MKLVAICLFFIMFIYSGFRKITSFPSNVSVLQGKTHLPLIINQLGMIGVILLEIVGASLLIYYELYPTSLPRWFAQLIYLTFMAFMIVVTFLYHPPWDKMIPFLSNLTTFGAFLYIYSSKFR